MNKKYKLTTMLLSAAIVFALVFSLSAAMTKANAEERGITASGVTGDVNWCLYDDGELVISGSGKMGSNSDSSSNQPWRNYCTLINKITVEENVTYIADHAFSGTYAKSASLPSTVTEIGSAAFSGCRLLESIDIPDSVTKIGSSVFSVCTNLKNVSLPENLKKIPQYAFNGCTKLETITIPPSVDTIRGTAFFDCKELKTLTFSATTSYIASSAFQNCSSLEAVYFGGTIANWCNIYFGSESANPLYPSAASLYLNGEKLGSKVTLDPKTTALREYVFAGFEFMEEIVFPSSITSISNQAFQDCTNLKEIDLSEVKTVQFKAFLNCTSLEKITFGKALREIGREAFSNCTGIKEFSVSEENNYFSNDRNGVLFNKDKTELLIYPAGSQTESYTVPSSVKTIKSYSFSNCANLRKIVIPDGVETIESYAFEKAQALSDITIGDTVSFIGNFAFYKSYYYNDKANWDNGFLYIGNNLILANTKVIPSECVLYSKTRLIAQDAFLKSEITSLYMHDNVRYINDNAFRSNVLLAKIRFSNNLAEIGSTAFCGCEALTEIEIPATVKSIGSNAFSSCKSLERITLSEGLESIGENAFSYLPAVKSVRIPSTVKSVSPLAFTKSGITDIYYNNTKAEWKRATGGESPEGITVHYSLKNDDGSVYIVHTDDDFSYESGNVHLEVSEITAASPRFDRNGYYSSNFINPIQVLDIILVDGDGNPIQPSEGKTITVRIKATEEFVNLLEDEIRRSGNYKNISRDSIAFGNDKLSFVADGKSVTLQPSGAFLASFRVIHWFSDGTNPGDYEVFRHDEIIFENGFISLETGHFSDYAICTSLSAIKANDIEMVNKSSKKIETDAAAEYELEFTSSDENIVTVDESGNVTAINPGKATVTVTIKGTDISGECTVTVTAREFSLIWNVDGKKTEVRVGEQTNISKPESPVKIGYTFSGWTPEVPDKMPASDVEFTAKWVRNTHTFTFDTKGGTAISPITLAYGETVTTPEEPTKDGYVFAGWSPEIPTSMPDSDMTFTAIWEETKPAEPVAPHITAISVSALPDKTVYTYKTDEFDATGLEVLVIYSDGSTETISDTSALSISGYDAKPVGEKAITVNYEGFEAQFNVTVRYVWWQWIIRILLLGFIWY